jgi:EmrB/QacA subfamily drug resistance transporter
MPPAEPARRSLAGDAACALPKPLSPPSSSPSPLSGELHPAANLRTREAFAAMLGVAFVTMLVALDQTVVGTALPRIVADLKGFALYAWVATAYLLASSITVPIMGRLGDLFGRKPFVLTSIIVFTGASALCGLSQSMLQLVLSRAMQGIGGGMLVGSAFAATADIFPDQMRRIRWQAMLSSAFGVSTAIGPSLGGWLTEHWGWRSVFYVNLPIGLVAVAVVARFLPRIAGHRSPGASIDWVGALLMATVIASLLLALEDGAHSLTDLHGLFQLIALLVAAGFLITLFLKVERRASQPILPLRLFQSSNVRLLALIGVFSGWAMFSLVFYAPLLLQAGFGYSPNQAGLIVSPLVACISLGSIINGRIFSRVSKPQHLLTFGICIFLSGCLAVIAVHGDAKALAFAGAFTLAGIGLGFQLPNLTIQIQAAVSMQDVGIASALIQTLRMLGSLVGAALSGVVVDRLYRLQVGRQLEAAGANSLLDFFRDPQVLVSAETRERLMAAAGSGIGVEHVDQLLQGARQALITAVHSALWISVVLCAVALSCAFRLPQFKPHSGRLAASPDESNSSSQEA